MELEDKEEARFIARLASRDERAFNELWCCNGESFRIAA